MEKKKKSLIVKIIAGVLVLIIAITYPYFYNKTIHQNWGCGYEIIHGNNGGFFGLIWLAIIFGYILLIYKPKIVGGMVILGLLGMAAAFLIPNYRAHQYLTFPHY